jgi:hypothetical protein
VLHLRAVVTTPPLSWPMTDESGWVYVESSAGPCAICDEQCRSIDPDGVPRHPTCEKEGT